VTTFSGAKTRGDTISKVLVTSAPLTTNHGIHSVNTTQSLKLSICIPTLNRGRFIGETLQSIVSQATDEVEIVIVDGGSTDHTPEVVAHFQTLFSRLRYFREDNKGANAPSASPSGGGFDRDCNRAVELAAGQYCWLFTDDDVLKPGAVEAVLRATRDGYALIVVNAEVRSSDFSQSLDPLRLRLTSDRTYEPEENESLFIDVANYLSFVGGVVIKRQLWLARDKDQYIGTGFIHVGVLLQSPISGQALVIAEPLITIRYGDALYMRSSRYFEIWMFLWPNLLWSFPDFSDAAKRRVSMKEPWRRYRTLLLFRAKGAYSAKEYREWLEGRLSSKLDKIAARWIASCPGSVANLTAFVYYYASGRHDLLLILDLMKSPFYFGRAVRALVPFHKAKTLAETLPI
jgi:abequosyltransferase